MPAESLQTLKRAIAVLDCFSAEQAELGVREVARRAGLSSSVTGRLLVALKEMGFLSQNPQTRAYSLGARVLRWAQVYHSNLDVRNHALPMLRELHQVTHETISLYILEGYERVCVERLESQQGVRIVTRIGQRLPLYAGSAGKVLLAYLPPAQQEEYLASTKLAAMTENTITDAERLRRELQMILEQGVAVSNGEWTADAAAVAAPILDRNGCVIAALAISAPISRFSDEARERYCKEVKRVAEQISTALGYRVESISTARGAVD